MGTGTVSGHVGMTQQLSYAGLWSLPMVHATLAYDATHICHVAHAPPHPTPPPTTQVAKQSPPVLAQMLRVVTWLKARGLIVFVEPEAYRQLMEMARETAGRVGEGNGAGGGAGDVLSRAMVQQLMATLVRHGWGVVGGAVDNDAREQSQGGLRTRSVCLRTPVHPVPLLSCPLPVPRQCRPPGDMGMPRVWGRPPLPRSHRQHRCRSHAGW